MTTFDPIILTKRLRDAGLTINGVYEDGRIEWGHEPTEQELTIASAVRTAYNPAIIESASATLRAALRTRIQSAVGKTVDTLTTAERNALMVALLYMAGAIDQDLIVLPPRYWLTPEDNT